MRDISFYHYTSLNGLLGILSKKALWATDVRFLNDQQEFAHALDFVKYQAGKLFEVDDYLEHFGWAVRDAAENVQADNLFVTSFSEKSDLLSQWRGYCPSSGGVCLGFSMKRLTAFCERFGYELEKCTYDHASQATKVEILVEQCFDRFPKHIMTRDEFMRLTTHRRLDASFTYAASLLQSPVKEHANDALQWFSEEITKLAPRFKHEGFHEEAEWRLIAKQPNQKVEFRVSGSASYLIPYIELAILGDSAGEALQEIIIGPNANQARCELSIQQLLKVHELHHVRVERSNIPFNNW